MAKRLRLGIDIDDVVVDFISAFKQEAEAVLGRKFLDSPTNWSFESMGLTKDEIARVWERINATDNWFFYNCVALPSVTANLPWLTESHDVYFITARRPVAGFSIQKQTQLHLSELGVEYPTVLVERNKGPIAAALRLDAFVDDKIENLMDISTSTEGRTRIFLMNQRYNLDQPIPATWTRVNNFEAFIDKVQELSQ